MFNFRWNALLNLEFNPFECGNFGKRNYAKGKRQD
jgi:hypothetical protein